MRLPLDHWLEMPAVVQRFSPQVKVLRDDLLEGGSKLRFLPYLVGDAKEVVFGGPFCGGAPLALSVLGRAAGVRITLFYAKRKELHPRQAAAQANGAKIVGVEPGYMTVVQKRARDYAEKEGALFLPLGFDVPQATAPLTQFANAVRLRSGGADQVWCASGSGMLARCLGYAFPDSEICAVPVGLASRHSKQEMPPNVRWYQTRLRFEQEETRPVPFPACRNYEAKAWYAMEEHRRGRALFWCVMGGA